MTQPQIQQYEKRLRELGERLRSELQHQLEAIAEEANPTGDDSSIPSHPADNSADMLDAEIAVGESQMQLLEQVRAAMARIGDGTFGKCVKCRRAIKIERLDAIPDIALCFECAEQEERVVS